MDVLISNMLLFGCTTVLIIGLIVGIARSLYGLAVSCTADNQPHDWLFSRTVPSKGIILYACSKCGKLKAEKASLEEIEKYENERYQLEERLRNMGD